MILMIKSIEQALYGYDKTEFLPITRDGQIDNWDEFRKYKAGKLLTRLHLDRQTMIDSLTYLNDVIAQNTFKPTN